MDSFDDKSDCVLKAALECRTELVAYARSLLGNYAAADDVFQEAMIVVVKKYHQFQEGTSMLAWCRSIVRIEVLRAKQRYQRERTQAERVLDDAIDAAFGEFQAARRHDEAESWREALRRTLRSGSRQDFQPSRNRHRQNYHSPRTPRLLTTSAKWLSAIVFFVALVLSSDHTYAADSIERPNVLFIAVDDLNDWVNCLGGHPQAKTPNIDALAKKGVLFEQAHCAAPLCSPSRTSIMMGLRPSTTGIYGNLNWFRDMPQYADWVTLPQYFRKHGYLAWGGGKLYHQAHGKFSDATAWDQVYSTRTGAVPPPKEERYKHGLRPKFESNPILARLIDWGPTDAPIEANPDWKTADGAARFLAKDHDRPFFLGCGIYLPHLPWYAPKKFFDMHPLEDIELPPYKADDFDDIPAIGKRMGERHIKHIRESGKWKEAVQGCLAADSFADACVGHVIDALEKSRYRDNTIVVLWGDHGYDVGEKKIAKSALWEQTTRTPLIIYASGKLPSGALASGMICKSPVSLVDLYPTLLDLCGLPKNKQLDGRSFAPLVREPSADWPYPAIITHSPHWLGNNHAVRSSEFHYIHYSDGGEELYDIKADPLQRKNIANDAAHASVKTELKKWLPRKNAPHYRRDKSASSESGQEQVEKPKHVGQIKRTAAPASRNPREMEDAGTSSLRSSVRPTTKRSPNVVTLYVDDLGYRDIGCYGGPVKTPVLDKLAAGGVRFTDFHSGAPTCSPSRATFLTGRGHHRTGVYSVLDERFHRMHLLESETTIAEVLKENGYATVHFGKWHLGMPTQNRDNPTPADHGFDYWFGVVNGPGRSHKNPTNFLRNGERVGEMKGYSCQIVVDEALTWLDQEREGDEPFFLNLWFNEPHDPIAAPDEIVSQYGGLNQREAIYSGTIDNTDRAIGRLVAKLERLGELDNTIIIYASDNGSYLQKRNGELRGKKGALFEGGHRVPGIFYWKDGIPGGRVEKEPAGVVDLLPTLCGLIGIDKPEGVHLDGSDLAPLLTETETFTRHQPLFWMVGANMVLRVGDHTLFASGTAKSPIDFKAANRLMEQVKEVLGDDLEKELGGMDLRSRMFNGKFATPEANRLRDQHRRLFYFQESWIPELKKSGLGRVQLYDLSKDLGQQNDIAKERPELVARLKEQAAAIYRSVMADAPDWPAPEERAAAKQSRAGSHRPGNMDRPVGTGPTPPSVKVLTTSATDDELSNLLTRIDRTELPNGYDVSNHQPWVDRRLEALKPEQRGRIGRLWKEKRRLQPKMENAGMSFVRILEYVAGGEKRPDASPPRPASADKSASLGKPRQSTAVSDIDPKGIYWHQWRGPKANGVSRTAKPPLEWSEDRNIKWKVAIEGKGNASPIVWGDKVFLLTAINTRRVDPNLPKPEDQPKRVFGITHPNTIYKFEVLCLDRKTGKELWRQTASEHVPHEGTHNDADFASASPTTDGQRLYCWFGSAGFYCYDLDGKKLWQRDLGKAYVGASLGEGCSPVVHKGRVAIVRDQARQSTIEVLDARTGKTLWKKDRDEPNAWATPRIVEHSGKTQVITAASKMVRSYDLDTGDIIWQCKGLTGNVTPCPVVEGGVVYCMSGYEGYSLLALPLDARGDISDSDGIIWSIEKGTPYVPSPVLYDGQLYFTQSNQGILTAVDSESGDTIIERTRLPGIANVYSSPVGADGRVYFTGRNGTTLVIKHSGELEVLATNKLDDEFNTSPAIVGTQILLRGRKSMYCIEDPAIADITHSGTRQEFRPPSRRAGSHRPSDVVRPVGTGPTNGKPTVEEKTRIHRLATTRRSVFDAFCFLNRLPEKPYDGESTDEFSGRIFGRLANQEGRILLKAPPGMNNQAYAGFKTFLGYEGTTSVGNCASCHSLYDFADGKSHVVTKGGKATATPSLRNLGKREIDVEKVLQKKLETSHLKMAGKADEISNEYAGIHLSKNDIPKLIAFLKLLDDVPDERFRELVIKATVLDPPRTEN